jgi:hypothetical protein
MKATQLNALTEMKGVRKCGDCEPVELARCQEWSVGHSRVERGRIQHYRD